MRERIIPTSALSRARTEDTAMPASKDFNNTDQEWHYALSWMACDYIADTFGESRLWELVDAMHNGGQGTADAAAGPGARPGARLRQPRARPPRRRPDPQPLRLSGSTDQVLERLPPGQAGEDVVV